MADCMEFPKTADEFIEQYKFTDTKQEYTNGAELISVFRAKQMMEHYFATDNHVGGKWIPVTERLPEPETEVVILAERKYCSFKEHGVTTHHIVTTGMYEDGNKNTGDSDWVWETDGFEYDEELDAYIIPEGWWEWKHYIDDECRNYAVDDAVTHWMPLPEPPKGE